MSDERRDRDDSLDRSSPEPAYSQLARVLRERIATGSYRPGERLPSIPELSKTFTVAKMTASKAIDLLAAEGVVTRERGSGTFVKSPSIASAVFDLGDLARQMTDDAVAVRVLEARSTSATTRVSEKLHVSEGALVICIRRLLLRDEQPAFYHSEYLIRDARRPLVEGELGVTSLRGLFTGTGHTDIKNGQLTLHASLLTESEACNLKERPGTPAWVVEHLFSDFGNRPASWGRFICRADRLTMTAHVGIGDDTMPASGSE